MAADLWYERNRHRPPAGVAQLQLRIDAQHLIDGRVDVTGQIRRGARPLTEPIRGADDDAALEAAAAHEAKHRVAPVIAAWSSHAHRRAAVAAVVHLWRAAEFAAQDHERRL